jgi:hypothetical protein
MAKDKKETEEKAREGVLRWFHPAGQIHTGRRLQQADAAGEWHDVPVHEEDAPDAEPQEILE